MAISATNKNRRAWERALEEYQAFEASFEKETATNPCSTKAAREFLKLVEARDRLLALKAPDLGAVARKLEIIVGPKLFRETSEWAAMRRAIGDICRLEFELTTASDPNEWDEVLRTSDSKPSEDDVSQADEAEEARRGGSD